MAKKKNCEWLEIKEVTPLKFMPYVAKLFREVTGQNLAGLNQFTGWIGLGGYYHWRVAQQGLVHLIPHLTGQPVPREPDAYPSGKRYRRSQPKLRPHPREPKEGGRTGLSQPLVGVDRPPPRARAHGHPPLDRAERPQHPSKVERPPLPTRAVGQPL